jgi:hypothetical protein
LLLRVVALVAALFVLLAVILFASSLMASTIRRWRAPEVRNAWEENARKLGSDSLDDAWMNARTKALSYRKMVQPAGLWLGY